MSSATLGWIFHLFNAIFTSLGKSLSAKGKYYLTLLMESFYWKAESHFLQLLESQRGSWNKVTEKQKCLQAVMDFNEVKERHHQEIAWVQRARCPSGWPGRVPCPLCSITSTHWKQVWKAFGGSHSSKSHSQIKRYSSRKGNTRSHKDN